MRWTRKAPGHYTSGAYTVQQIEVPPSTPRAYTMQIMWQAVGPGINSRWLRKAEAQRACKAVADRRAQEVRA